MTQYICSKMFTDLNIKFPYNSIKNCCKSNDTIIEVEELNLQNSLIENKEYMRRKSSMLFDNRLPDQGCDTCIQTEPNSLFRNWNQWNDKISLDQKDYLYNADSFNTYEFVLSSACDLKCVYCAPKDSSSWAKELGVPVNRGNPEWEEKVLDELFLHLAKKQFNLDRYFFFFSGGEPTYNPKTLWMIEKILSIVPVEKSSIVISTNANSKPAVFQKYLDLIRKKQNVNWIFDCSIDGTYEKCEAIRYGIDWNLAISNITQLLSEPNVTVRISPTVNIYSVLHMGEFVDFFINLFQKHNRLNRYMFNLNMVQEPGLSPMSMPARYTKFLDYPIAVCNANNLQFHDHLIDIQKLIGTKIDNNTADHIQRSFDYFKLKRPDTEWERLFPHVTDIINELKLT